MMNVHVCIYMCMYKCTCVCCMYTNHRLIKSQVQNMGMVVYTCSPSQTCFARESASLTEMHTTHSVSHTDTLVTLVTADRRLPSLVAVYLAAAPSTRASESSVMPATDLLAQDTSFPAGWGGREREGEGGREREGEGGMGGGEEKDGSLML